MAPSASLDCSKRDKELTYTYLNCALQNDSLNQKVWKYLENHERLLATEAEVSVHVKLEFSEEQIFGARIPSGFYKTISIDGDSIRYYFPNERPVSKNFEYYRCE